MSGLDLDMATICEPSSTMNTDKSKTENISDTEAPVAEAEATTDLDSELVGEIADGCEKENVETECEPDAGMEPDRMSDENPHVPTNSDSEVISAECDSTTSKESSPELKDVDERVKEPSVVSKGAESSTSTSSGNKSASSGATSSKSKKKEDKSIEHILRALNSLSTSEEKLAALCKKYSDLLEEHRLQQTKMKQNQRKLTLLAREKEHLQNEHGKAVLAKSKLENLCRELQRHNKLVKEESLARARDEEEKRKEITSKFQATINDIQQQMNEHYTKNTKLREENVELANKLKNLIEQYELREQHIEKVFKHKDLEQQLVDAKLAQANLQLHEDKEKSIKEKQELLEGAVAAQEKIGLLEGQEKQLRAQVALYTEKYEEFQNTLSKSNEVFQTFKAEMDKMTKKIKKLEKDTTMWKTRWENSNKALIEMAEEKTKSDKEISQLRAKVSRLEKLCRALQSDSYKNADKQNNVDSNKKEESDEHIDTKDSVNNTNDSEVENKEIDNIDLVD